MPKSPGRADYLAGNDYRKAANDAVLSRLPAQRAAVCKPMPDVRPEYLNAGYDEVKAAYGTFYRYPGQGPGIDVRELKELRKDLLLGRRAGRGATTPRRHDAPDRSVTVRRRTRTGPNRPRCQQAKSTRRKEA
ncbi:tyrosine-protein phosphatase [Streptomyces sp. NPDC054838]